MRTKEKTIGDVCGHMLISSAARLAAKLGIKCLDTFNNTKVRNLDSDQLKILARALKVSTAELLA